MCCCGDKKPVASTEYKTLQMDLKCKRFLTPYIMFYIRITLYVYTYYTKLHYTSSSLSLRSRFLRSEDRANNAYPTLDYPEMYLLNGGYKQFYAQHQDLCEGGYLPMADPSYKSDFQTFRSKSKTWSCDYKANKSLSKPRKRLGI